MNTIYAPIVAKMPPPELRPTAENPVDKRGIVHGMGVPPQYTDPSTWQYRDTIPFICWSDTAGDIPMFTPMSWSGAVPAKGNDGRQVLVYNEPEYNTQGAATPERVVRAAAGLNHWHGGMVLGNWSYKDGRRHAEETFSLLPDGANVTALGLHVYAIKWEPVPGGIFLDRMRWWRQFADSLNLPIWVTEWGMQGYGEDETVAGLSELYTTIAETLRPQRMYYFSWSYADFWPAGDAFRAGQWTEVGRKWKEIAHID